jgi:copper chaperone CopZ
MQEGVIWAIVNFAASEATIHYDPSQFNKARMIEAMNKLGFMIEHRPSNGNSYRIKDRA